MQRHFPALVTAALLASGCATQQPASKVVLDALCAPGVSLQGMDQRTLLGVGYEALQQNNIDCAERLIYRAYTLDTRDPWAHLNLGVLHHRQGRLDAARLAYQMAAALDPKSNGGILSEKSLSPQARDSGRTGSNGRLGRSAGEIALANMALIP